MCAAAPKELVARYVPNEKRKLEERSKPSFLIDYLAEHFWVPDKAGVFLRPDDVVLETLHPDFSFDNRNGWLTAIKFGEKTKRRSEEYQDQNRIAKTIGFASAEVATEVAKLLRDGVVLDDFRAYIAQRKKPEQPNESVRDPARRRKNVLADAADAPSKESVARERSIQKGVSEVTAQAKAYLRSKYMNADRQLICQCCHDEMPFTLRSGDHYFEAVQCFKDQETRHYQNRLALCPNCAAMYQHARELEDAEVHRRIVEHDADEHAPAVEIPVRLADRDLHLRFVGSHWLDLKTILKGKDDK